MNRIACLAAVCLAACAARSVRSTTAEGPGAPVDPQSSADSTEASPPSGSADADEDPNKPVRSAAPLPELAPREELPLEAREALGLRMERHAEQMTYLMALVVLLRFDDVAELAEMVAKEPKLGRPAPGEKSTLNAMLPRAFFDHQDQLEVRAKQLAEAARQQDQSKIVQAFGALTETCVNCHATYLQDEVPAMDEDGRL